MIPVEAASPAVTFTSSRNIRLLMTATLAAGIAYAGHELFEDLALIHIPAEFSAAQIAQVPEP